MLTSRISGTKTSVRKKNPNLLKRPRYLRQVPRISSRDQTDIETGDSLTLSSFASSHSV